MRSSHLRDQRVTPWKNGGGTTTELFVLPPDATIENFDLRISRARIERAGPFSLFPGIDRTLVVVTGHGISLQPENKAPITLTPQTEPFCFSGEQPISATLLDGPTDDLNVMTRRTVYRHRVERTTLHGTHTLVPPGNMLALLVLDGFIVHEGTTYATNEGLLSTDRSALVVEATKAVLLRVDVFSAEISSEELPVRGNE